MVMLQLKSGRRPSIACILVACCLHALVIEALQIGKKWALLPPAEDRGDRNKFGQATCTSSDGKRFAVGANGFDRYRGAVYIYDLVRGTGNRAHHWRRKFLQGISTRSAERKKTGELRIAERGSGFGFSCAFDDSGKTLAVSAPGHDLQKGAVYVFKVKESTQKWEEVAFLAGPQGRNGDSFGWAVAMSGNGDIIAVSAKGRRANNGEVYIFNESVSGEDLSISYELSGRIQPPDFTNEEGPNGIRIRNNFGVSVSMSGDGSLLGIGCTGFQREQGAVYVVRLEKLKKQSIAKDDDNKSKAENSADEREDEGRNWEIVQRLEAPEPSDFGFFGYKLAMSSKGSTIAVGADGEDEYRGSVYVFEQCGNETNLPLFCVTPVRLRAPKPMPEDNYGGSVSISGNGAVLVVGSPGANNGVKGDKKSSDHGAVYIYERHARNSTWDLAGNEALEKDQKRANAFYAWDTSISHSGHMVLTTSPEYESASGLVTVTHILGVSSAVDDIMGVSGMISSVLTEAQRVLTNNVATSNVKDGIGIHEDL